MSGINIFEHHWFLLVARPNRVFKAAAALQDRGLVTALPYGWRSRRRGSRHCKSVHRFPRPELGNYLMTGFPHSQPAWRSLFEDPLLLPLLYGVVSVTSNGMPTPIRPTEIFRQQNRYGDGLYSLPPKSVIEEIEDQQLEVGMAVRVGRWKRYTRGQEEFDSGGFADKVVIISQIYGEIAVVLLPMFASEREAQVPITHLHAA